MLVLSANRCKLPENRELGMIRRQSAKAAWPELRTELHKRGLTAADLARFLSISYYTLHAWTCGYTTPPQYQIQRIADALGVELDTILPKTDQALREIRSRVARSPRLKRRTLQALQGEIPAPGIES